MSKISLGSALDEDLYVCANRTTKIVVPLDGDSRSEYAMSHVITVKRYTGNQVKATKAYQVDVDDMASRGYVPVSQSWSPGEWTGGNFLIALLLCFILIGFLAFLYMIIVTPDGTLTVSYELRTA